MNSLEIKDAREQLKKRGLEIVENCKKELRDLNEDEQKELAEIREKIKEKDKELKEIEDRLNSIQIEDNTENKTINSKNIMPKTQKFSLVRAIRAISNNQTLDPISEKIIKMGQEEARNAGISTQGQLILPTNIDERATISVASEGEDVVATDLFNIMEPLRANSVLVKAGAKVYDNLSGNIKIPVMSKSNVFWENENDEAQDGAGAFTSVACAPKRLTCFIDISKLLLAQDSIGVENAIRQDLINAISAKLEETILSADAGDATKPAGIFNTIAPSTVANFKDICDLEAKVADANVINPCKYIVSNKAKAGLRNMAKSAKSTQLVMEQNMIDGTETFATSNVPNDNFVYGDFSNLALCYWSGIDLTVDNFTKAKSGEVRLVVNLYCDTAILRKEAFATGKLS